MNMKKIYSAAAAMLACLAASAQNLNPTVEVTNTYRGNSSEVHKPQLDMAIPDSLLRFDMDFGYEVFDKPYQGAYNFKPYMLAMKPGKDAYRGRKLYLRAGAGYSLHPQLEFAFSPEQEGPFQMSVYATHKSYFGRYNVIKPVLEDDFFKLDRAEGKGFKGYDALTTAGFEGRYNFSEAILNFGVGYYGLMSKDTLQSRHFNAVDFHLGAKSNKNDEKYLFYDVSLKGRFGSDGWKYSATDGNLREGVFRFDANVGPVLSYFHKLLVGLEAEGASYSDFFDVNAGRVAVVPKYVLESGRWNLSLGLRLEKLFRSGDSESLFEEKGNTIYPDVHAAFTVSDKVLLYAGVTGGARMNTYSSMIASNHHLTPFFGYDSLMDNSVEKMNVRAGVKGNLWSRLQFDLSGGGTKVLNGPLDYYATLSLLPAGVAYADYSLIFADLLLGMDAGKVRLDGDLRYRKMSVENDANGFMLPVLSGNLRAVYNFNPRVYAGVDIEAAGARKGNVIPLSYYMETLYGEGSLPFSSGYYVNQARIPGYLDLGLVAGYRLNRKLDVWLESGNLLCETIQRNPFYSEKDLWITAGITLSL